MLVEILFTHGILGRGASGLTGHESASGAKKSESETAILYSWFFLYSSR